MTSIEFDIPGTPVAWARSGHYGNRHYTKPRQKAHGDLIAMLALEARPPGMSLLSGPIDLWIVVRFKRGQACLERHLLPCSGDLFWHPTDLRHDWDNCGKIVSDGIRGILIEEDGLIVRGAVWKVCGPVASTRVVVRSLIDERHGSGVPASDGGRTRKRNRDSGEGAPPMGEVRGGGTVDL